MEKTKVDKLKEMMKAKKEAEEKKPPAGAAGPDTGTQRSGSEEQKAEDEMSAQLKAAENEAKAHYDKLLRVMAEFENFKKRMEKERMEQAKYANQSLMHDLLPVMDDLDRVIEHIPAEAGPDVSAIADGVRLIQNHFISALAKHGLTHVECSPGEPFDPSLHEAVAHIDSEQKEGSVAAVHRRGWKLHDRVIRPSTVAVSKGRTT